MWFSGKYAKKVKAMIAQWEIEAPGRTDVIMRSLKNVVPSHLADGGLFDFEGLGKVLG
jgi:tRNA 2-thiocytidine biosynthesis protein TtcA